MDQPVELQLGHWLRIVRQHARMVTAVVLLGAAAGLLSALLAEATYTARTSLLLQQSLSDQANDGVASIQSLAQLAESDLVRRSAQAALASPARLSVSVSPDGQVLTFRATAASALQAQRAADAYAEAFRSLSENAADRQLASAERSLQAKVDQLDRALVARRLSVAARAVLVQRRANYVAALNRLLVRRELLAGGQSFVVSLAEAPETADSRKAGFHVALGGVAGLVLAAVLVGFVDRREDLVRSERDLASRLAEVPGGRSPTLVPLMPAGRQPWRAARRTSPGGPAPVASPEADAYAVLRASMEPRVPPSCRVIMVAEAGPGGAAAKVAVNLAAACARAGRRTVVASLDFRGDGSALREEVLGREPRATRKIVGLPLARSGRVASAAPEVTKVYPLAFLSVPGDDNLALATSGHLKAPDDLVTGASVQQFLDSLADFADVIVLELPGVMASPDAMLVWPACHDALLVAQIGRSRGRVVLDARDRLMSRPQQWSAIAVLGPSRWQGATELRSLIVPRERSEQQPPVPASWPAAVTDDRVV